jgi:hypothetical protein
MRRWVVLAITLGVPATTTRAQHRASPGAVQVTSAPLPAGTRVRVWAPAASQQPRVIGSVLASDSAGLTIDAGARGVWSVPLTTIASVEVSRGPAPRVASLAAGGALGLALGLLVGRAMPGRRFHRRDTAGELVGPASVGAAVGLTFGHFVRPERWERVFPPRD